MINEPMDYKTLFKKQIANGRVHHAYMILGKYADKMGLARWMAETLGCSKADILVLAQDEKDIPLAEVRELKRSLALSPYNSPYKVAIVELADRLGAEGQNALLKILEEPAARAVLILLVENEDGLLKTVISRCQKIILEPEIENIAKAGAAIPVGLLSGKMTVAERFELAKKLAEEKDLTVTLDRWLLQIREVMLTKPDNQYLIGLIGDIQEAKRMLQSNASSRIILENLLLNFEGQ